MSPSHSPRVVRAGPVTALLDGSFLRRITIGRHEVLRGVYAAVRDHNWGTIEPTYRRFEVEQGADAFRVTFVAEHRQGEIDFVWDGQIVGEASGRITFRLDGLCQQSFRKNRLGFCVLHPPTVAGTPYVRQTPGGPIEERFPTLISPSRDVTDMSAIEYMVGPIAVAVRFEGDLFDMEDQRNWTDASYKTFCTPLAQPYPVRLAAGQRISQTVTLEIDAPPATTDRSVASPAPTPAVPSSTADRGVDADVAVRSRAVGRLPALGLGAPYHGRPLAAPAIARLRSLRLAHLRVEVDLRGADWPAKLASATADAAVLGLALEVAALTDDTGRGLESLGVALANPHVPLVRLAAFSDRGWVTTSALVGPSRAIGGAAAIGGGSRTDFAQFNMQQARLPFGQIDFATFAINPQVHTFDDMSILETLGVQADTVASARALAGPIPIAVGPITLRPRFNPNATSAEPPLAPDQPPPHADPRQREPITAAWTVGSLHRLAATGVTALTYFETVGASGVTDEAGRPYPVFDVFAAVAAWAGAEVLEVDLADPLAVEALALRVSGRVRVVVANLLPTARTVTIALPDQDNRAVDLLPYGVAIVETSPA